jgi:transcription termination factor NusB
MIILINNSNTSTTTVKSITKKVTPEIRKTENNSKKEEEQLNPDHERFEKEKQITKIVENTDVIRLNVSDEMMMTTLETLTPIPKSILSMIFGFEHHTV